MMKDYLKMAFSNIFHRKLRSWLTMIGIFIGIAAVVSLISLGQGLQAAITDQFGELGTDILIIQPKGAGFITSGADNPSLLTEDDERIIRRTSGVIETSGMVFRSAEIGYKDEINFQFVTGIPTDDVERRDLATRMAGMKIEDGRMLESGDKYKGVAGNAYKTEDAVFSRTLRVGDRVTIQGVDIDIVGIIEKTGSPPDDKQIIVPMETAEELLDLGSVGDDMVRDYIIAQTTPNGDPEVIAESVKRNLRDSRNVDEGDEDFQLQTAEQLLSSFNVILAVVQAVLIGIAAISLLVGGIGIMNTMYTSVLERTKEIGIMKAIGARNSDVLKIFLIESGVLGIVGGAIGILIGFGISSAVTGIAASYLGNNYLSTFFPWWLVVGGLTFSFIVGAASGVFPAMQASRMDPVDALRYE